MYEGTSRNPAASNAPSPLGSIIHPAVVTLVRSVVTIEVSPSNFACQDEQGTMLNCPVVGLCGCLNWTKADDTEPSRVPYYFNRGFIPCDAM